MRKILVSILVLAAFAAEARPNSAPNMPNAPQTERAAVATENNLKERAEPVYKRYEIKYAPEANKAPNEVKKVQPEKKVDMSKPNQPAAPAKTLQPDKPVKKIQPAQNKVVTPRHNEITPPKNEPKVVKKDIPNKKNPPVSGHEHHKDNHHKPDVRVNINVNSPRHPVVTETVVSAPVVVVRPGIYDNNIYSSRAYGCGERNGVKYCTDYRGRALNGRVVQNYGNQVAYENYRSGYQSGETTVFSPEGLLLRKTDYKKSLKHGKEYVYFDNGKVEYSAEYKKGALNGNVEQYNRHGKRIGQMTFRKGYLQTRRCVLNGGGEDPAVIARIHEKNYNELILCPDY